MFLTWRAPTKLKFASSLFLTCSYTAPEISTPPGVAKDCSRAGGALPLRDHDPLLPVHFGLGHPPLRTPPDLPNSRPPYSATRRSKIDRRSLSAVSVDSSSTPMSRL